MTAGTIGRLKTDSAPSSHASEIVVLSLMLWHGDCRDRALQHLREEDFHFGNSRQFFRMMKQATEERTPVESCTIAERILNANPEGPGRQNALGDWIDIISTGGPPEHLDWHMEKLIDTSTRRQVHLLAGRIQDEALDNLPEFSSKELIDSAEDRLRKLRRDTGNGTERDMRDLCVSYGDHYEAALEGRHVTNRSVQIGLPSIDRENRGPFGSELVVIAARPSVGKTAIALQIALAAAQTGHPSYIFSMEMDEIQIRDRAISHLSHLPLSRVMSMEIVGPELMRYTQALGEFSGKCRLNFKQGQTVGDICANAREVHRALGLKLIVIDYLGRIRQDMRHGSSVAERIGWITGELKTLASELKTPVILLAQLNRESEKAGRKPMLSDLRDSGAIEQDADQVWALHAPNGIQAPQRTLIVLKGRNTGAGHRVYLNFLTEIQRFEESATKWDEEEE